MAVGVDQREAGMRRLRMLQCVVAGLRSPRGLPPTREEIAAAAGPPTSPEFVGRSLMWLVRRGLLVRSDGPDPWGIDWRPTERGLAVADGGLVLACMQGPNDG